MPTEGIFKNDSNDWVSALSLISRVELSEDRRKEIEAKHYITEDFIQILMEEADRLEGIRVFGLDILVEEESNDMYLIDLNDIPSYIGVTGMHDALAKMQKN